MLVRATLFYASLALVATLIACFVLKLAAILNAIRFLRCLGPKDAALLSQTPIGRQALDQLQHCGAAFFPFGLKDFRLHRFIEKQRGLLRFPFRFFQNCLFRFGRLANLTCLVVVVCATGYSCNPSTAKSLSELDKALLWLAAALPLVGNAALALEFIYSNAVLGGYAIPFHGVKALNTPKILVELDVFLRRVGTALLGGATLSYVAALEFGALNGMPDSITGFSMWTELLNRAGIYWNCWYYSVTTFTTIGYGEIAPKNIAGQATAVLIMLQSFCLIVLVFASLMSSSSSSKS